MVRRVAQVHMDDHQIDDKRLLSQLEQWDEGAAALKKARDAYTEKDKTVKAAILAKQLPAKARRIRCGAFLIRILDIKAGEVKSRRRARRAVKISKATA